MRAWLLLAFLLPLSVMAATDQPPPGKALPGSPAVAAGGAPVSQLVAAAFSASDAYAELNPRGDAPASVYMTLENNGSVPIVIHSISSPIAAKAEFHKHRMDANGTMSMIKLDSLKIPPHQQAELRPGGLHVMLFDLTQTPKTDERFPLTFIYNDGAVMTTDVPVLSQKEVQLMRRDAASARPVGAEMYRSGRTATATDMQKEMGMDDKSMPDMDMSH